MDYRYLIKNGTHSKIIVIKIVKSKINFISLSVIDTLDLAMEAKESLALLTLHLQN